MSLSLDRAPSQHEVGEKTVTHNRLALFYRSPCNGVRALHFASRQEALATLSIAARGYRTQREVVAGPLRLEQYPGARLKSPTDTRKVGGKAVQWFQGDD